VKKIIVPILCFFSLNNLIAQTDSICHLSISLLTCTPGAELYSTFGHSALRVKDSTARIDIIYNYGTFDFDDPSFYSKFVRGKLLYFVSVEEFSNFIEAYTYEQRGITEQPLNLSCTEKDKLFLALQENAKEENKYYKYDFVSDNCTTRLRDIVFKNAGPVVRKDIRPAQKTSYRNLIHEYLNKSHQYWSKLGIDILMASPVDRRISNEEAMFLPDYLLKGFDSTRISSGPLVSGKSEILQPALQNPKAPLLSPFTLLSILFLGMVVLGFLKSTHRFFSVFDFILFFFSGALGLLILFMWFGTDHPECKNNFNLAWALPLHFIVVFIFYKKWTWLKFYFLANAILLALLLISWKWLPQEMNNALLPIVGLLLVRSLMRYKKMSYAY
jgi:hypothetical protein